MGTTTTTVKPTADPYFTHYDPREEHDAYKKAERRFEDHHRAKVSKVMKDSDLEEKYQEMREKDPASAEDFKKKMTERFQKNCASFRRRISGRKATNSSHAPAKSDLKDQPKEEACNGLLHSSF